MNRISKWIQKRKSYSNPLFGTMVILGGMAFPVFNVAAAIEQPVQPMAQTAEQVAEALDAVDAGYTINESFGIQPVPIRDLVKFHKTIFETLFTDSFSVSTADYYLDEEVAQGDVFLDNLGSTTLGLGFSVRFASLQDVDLVGGALTAGDANSLADVGASILSFAGTISSDNASVNVFGLVWQVTRPHDGVRVRYLHIIDIVDQTFIDDLESVYLSYFALLGDVGDPLGCAQALYDAAIAYRDALGAAAIQWQTCNAIAQNIYIAALAACGSGSIGSAWVLPGLGALAALVAGATCSAAATAALLAAHVNCNNSYNASKAIATLQRDSAYQAARDMFGEDCVPGNPSWMSSLYMSNNR